MSSKRDIFYALCRKLWTAGTIVFAASAIFIGGSQYTPHAQAQWNGDDTHIFQGVNTNIADDREAGSLVVDGTLTISATGTVTTSENTVLGSGFDSPDNPGGIININGGLLEIGAAAYPTDKPVFGGSRVTVNQGKLALNDGSSFDDAARLLLNGNVTITGTGKNDTTASLGSYALINASKAEANFDLGYYYFPNDTLDYGEGNVAINTAGIEMGANAAILGGTGGMTISASNISGTASGSVIAGNQVLATAGDMNISGSELEFGNDQVDIRSHGEMTFTNSTLEAANYHVNSGGNIRLEGSTLKISDGHAGGNIHSAQDVTITGSNIGQGNGGRITGTVITINNGSSITQGNVADIYARQSLLVNASTVKQGNDGVIYVTGTPGTLESIDIINGAKITQGDNGIIEIGVEDGESGGNINITGAQTEIEQGNSGKIIAYSNRDLAGSITIDSAKVTQGADAEIFAGNMMTLTGATVTQGTNATIFADNAMALVGTTIGQGDSGKIRTNQDAITIDNSRLTQKTNGEIESKTTLGITNSSNIIQGDQGKISSGDDLSIVSSNVTQGDDSEINIGKDLMLQGNSTITQDDSSRIIAAGTITTELGTTITQGDNAELRGNSVTLAGNVVQEKDSQVVGTTALSIMGKISQENNGTIFSNGEVSISGNGEVQQGKTSNITGLNGVTISGGTVTQDDDGTIVSNGAINISGGSKIAQRNDSTINGLSGVTIADATITQDDDGTIRSNGAISISGNSEITQRDNATINGLGGITMTGGTISQKDSGNIESGDVLSISGNSVITQRDNSTIFGLNGITMTGGRITQGDNVTITTGFGQNITLGGTITQGDIGQIRTNGGGTLAFNAGTVITQGRTGTIFNDNTDALNLDNVKISQEADSKISTKGDLNITNGSEVTQEADSTIELIDGKLTVDNARLNTGPNGFIQTKYLGGTEMTDEEKKLAETSIDLQNGATVRFGVGTRVSSLNPFPGGIDNDTSAFHKIVIGSNSVLSSQGLLAFENDWIELQDSASLRATELNGMIHLTNNSRLYGTGKVETRNGLVVTGGSVLAPGGNFGEELGSMTIEGPLTITDTGILEIGTSGNQSDFIVVKDGLDSTGNVMIADGGTLRMTIDTSELLTGNVYSIIYSDGHISGQFQDSEVIIDDGSGILSNLRFFDIEQWVDRSGPQDIYNVGLVRQDYFGLIGRTYNQRAGGHMLDRTPLNGEWLNYLITINNEINQGNLAVLDMVAGVSKANGMYLYRETPWRAAMQQYSWNMCGQVQLGYRGQCSTKPTYLGYQNRGYSNSCLKRDVWATPYHTESKYRSDGNARKYDAHTTGFMAGINYSVSPRTVFGIVFGYGRPELDQGQDEIEMDDFLIGLQAGTMITSKVELKAFVGGGFQQYSMRRFLNGTWLGTGPNTFARSDYDGNTLFASIELARPVYFANRTMLRPVIAFESENVWQDAFSEKSNHPFGLRYDKATFNQAFFRVGASGEADMGAVSLMGHAFYSCQLLSDTYSDSDVRLNLPGMDFQTIRGIDLDRNFLNVGGGAYMYLNPMRTATLSANYDASISDKSTTHTVFLGVNRMF